MTEVVSISSIDLLFSWLFIGFAAAVAWWFSIGNEIDILVASVRALIQLMLMGYVLKWLFSGFYGVYVYVAVALAIAAHNASRYDDQRRLYSVIGCGVAITFSVVAVLLFLRFTGIVPWKSRYLIPLLSMALSSAMYVSAQTVKRVVEFFKTSYSQLEWIMSTGVGVIDAIKRVISPLLKIALINRVESLRMVGLIHLPGGMTGMILMGAKLWTAVKMQLVIMYILTTTALISAVIYAVFYSYLILRERMYF